MAITKIHAIKSTLGKALAYIENPDKTDGQMLVSGYNCEPQTASIDFEMTAVLAHKARNLKRKRSTNLAYHLIQSFSPEDAVTPEQAHELGKKLAFEYTGGKYEYVVATHIDKGHIHNHIMINAVSFYDYKKLRTVPYRTARQIRDISDRLCMGQRTTRAKLMSYFSAEALRRGVYEFDIPFSRQQLADYLGVERSGLSVELGKMRDEGLLDFHKSHFLLKTPEADRPFPSAR